jgi:hypothetical protein
MSVETRTFTATSPAAPSTVVATDTIVGLDKFEDAMVVATLACGADGTLDVYLQAFDGQIWFDYLHFAQISAGAAVATFACPISRRSQRVAPLAVGTGSALGLAAATCVGGDFGDRFRVVFVAGESTSAGAAQTIRILGTRITS